MTRSLHDALSDAAPPAEVNLSTGSVVSRAERRRRRRFVAGGSILVVVVLAAGVALAASGRQDADQQIATESSTAVPPPIDTVLVPSTADARVSCFPGDDQHAFRARQLSGPTLNQMEGAMLPSSITDVLNDPNIVGQHPDGWRPVLTTDTTMTFLSGDGHYEVSFVMTDGSWRLDNSGSCPNLYVAQPGLLPATLTWSAPAPSDPQATTLHLAVNLLACNGGAYLPADRLVGPLVEYASDRITITYAVRPYEDPSGNDVAMTCQSNPLTPVVVQLDQPLDGRPIYDGTTYPTAAIGGG